MRGTRMVSMRDLRLGKLMALEREPLLNIDVPSLSLECYFLQTSSPCTHQYLATWFSTNFPFPLLENLSPLVLWYPLMRRLWVLWYPGTVPWFLLLFGLSFLCRRLSVFFHFLYFSHSHSYKKIHSLLNLYHRHCF